MTPDPIAFAGLMPHAPVLVPGVGPADYRAQVNHTTDAMATTARHALNVLPDTLVLLSPHSPREPGALALWMTPLLRGSLGQFGAQRSHVALPLDVEFAGELEKQIKVAGVRTWRITDQMLDHGATVPFSYLVADGWSGPTIVIGLSDLVDVELAAAGEAIRKTAAALGRRVAIIASGDMSHCLSPSGPYGYDPDGPRFDRAFIDLLRTGAASEIPRLDATLVEHAGQDVIEATSVALAAAHQSGPATVLSYEGPFGVGYGVAILAEQREADRAASDVQGAPMLSHCADLPRVARCSVEARLTNRRDAPPFTAAGNLARPRPVFVTLRRANGELRGCYGMTSASHANLVDETWHCARRSAFHDPRFAPLAIEEFDDVRFSVSILGEFEPVTSPQDLDPALYGILVRTIDGRRSLLLPGIKGIETAAAQVRAARTKGGMGADEWIEMERFTASTYHEAPSTHGSTEGA